MQHRIIDKWKLIPDFVLANDNILFYGLYIPKGAHLSVHDKNLIEFNFAGNLNPKLLLRSPNWNLLELEFIKKAYQNQIAHFSFSSCQLKFVDIGEKHASPKYLEGVVTASTEEKLSLQEIQIFSLTIKDKEQYTDYEYFDERDHIFEIDYEIDVDCAILVKLSNEQSPISAIMQCERLTLFSLDKKI